MTERVNPDPACDGLQVLGVYEKRVCSWSHVFSSDTISTYISSHKRHPERERERGNQFTSKGTTFFLFKLLQMRQTRMSTPLRALLGHTKHAGAQTRRASLSQHCNNPCPRLQLTSNFESLRPGAVDSLVFCTVRQLNETLWTPMSRFALASMPPRGAAVKSNVPALFLAAEFGEFSHATEVVSIS